jgi:hypothetical protein
MQGLHILARGVGGSPLAWLWVLQPGGGWSLRFFFFFLSWYIAQDGLELFILLPQSPQEDYSMCAPISDSLFCSGSSLPAWLSLA